MTPTSNVDHLIKNNYVNISIICPFNSLLLSLGFKIENIKFYGLGTMYPVVKSEGHLSDLEPMPENRRVEIYEYRRVK